MEDSASTVLVDTVAAAARRAAGKTHHHRKLHGLEDAATGDADRRPQSCRSMGRNG